MPWTYIIGDLKGEEIVGTFQEKELNKNNLRYSRIENNNKEKRLLIIC